MKIFKISPKWLLLAILIIAGIFLWKKVPSFYRNWMSGFILRKEINVEKTVLSILSVKTLAKWETAEYRGEVLYSLKEFREEGGIEDEKAALVAFEDIKTIPQLNTWEDSVWQFAEDAKEAIENSTGNFRRYKNGYGDLLEKAHFTELLQMLGLKKERKLFMLLKKGDLFDDRYYRKIDNIKRLLVDRPKKDLVLLGRGSVSAGFNLDSLNVADLKISRQNDTLLIQGMPQVQIFPAVIKNNDYGKKEIPGYEEVLATKSRSITSTERSNVKKGCKAKLEKNALKSGLLENAIVSAEMSLLGILQALGNLEVNKIIIVQ